MDSDANGNSKWGIYIGRTLSILATLWLLMDGVMKLFKPSFVVEATTKLGYPESTIVGIGVTLLVCTVLYVFRRTSALAAILLTGYLGGAVASNVRAGTGWFNTLFPAIFSVVIWLGLWLRDSRLRQLCPLANDLGRSGPA